MLGSWKKMLLLALNGPQDLGSKYGSSAESAHNFDLTGKNPKFKFKDL